MNGALFIAALWLFSPPAQSTSPDQATPLRETFVVAAETVIDDAGATDAKADDAHFTGQMQQLKQAEDNLTNMADDDREKGIAASMKDVVFQISSCHIQSIDGTDTTKCQAQIETARNRAMETIHKHKSGGAWVDGPPA